MNIRVGKHSKKDLSGTPATNIQHDLTGSNSYNGHSGFDSLFIITIFILEKDGMVNATMLCKAGDKQFNDYMRNKQSQDLIEAIRSILEFPFRRLLKLTYFTFSAYLSPRVKRP